MFKKQAKDIIVFKSEWSGVEKTLPQELEEIRKEIKDLGNQFYKFRNQIEEYLKIDISITPEVVKYSKMKKGQTKAGGTYFNLIESMKRL